MRRHRPAVQTPHLNGRDSESSPKPTDHADNADPMIVFTGNRGNDHYEVVVQGKVVELSLSCLKVMIELVIARRGTGTGFVRVNAVAICRLRRALDEAVGLGAGHAFVETGNAEEYRLAIPRHQIKAKLAITSCFLELVKLKAVSRDRASALRRLCHSVSSEIDQKS